MLVQRHSTGERTAPRVVAAVRRPDEMELLVPIRIVKAVSDTAEADALGLSTARVLT